MGRLEMKGISKAFAGVTVLDGVDLTVEEGQVMALLGENGAGKSTLMKILTGVYVADRGEVHIDGKPVAINRVQDAERHGIGMIHQELNLFANLSIEENFLIGFEREISRAGVVNYRRLRKRTIGILDTVNLNRRPETRVSELGVGEQQLVEIGKALQRNVRFLVMDEPTAALTEGETNTLFRIIASLKQRGVGIIYISHRLEELYRVSDTVTVLRDGRFIARKETAKTEDRELVSLMVGRDIEQRYPRIRAQAGDVLLESRNLCTYHVRDITLTVRAGEVVGLGGLMGAGRTEVARALAGIDKLTAGQLEFRGHPISFRSPREAMNHGIAYVTEDRKTQGLLLPFSVRENMALPTLASRSHAGLVARSAERLFVDELVQRLGIKVRSIEQPVASLSGGNQQKVVIGKWLGRAPALFILDEPTRGVDVGAKFEIYGLINEMKTRGKGILIISSDLPELLGLCDRVYVMHERTIVGHLQDDGMNQEEFMTLATGGAIK